jgi:hypothetical protein
LVRLDQLSALNDNNRFYEFMHLNIYGQQIATATFLKHLKERLSFEHDSQIQAAKMSAKP